MAIVTRHNLLPAVTISPGSADGRRSLPEMPLIVRSSPSSSPALSADGHHPPDPSSDGDKQSAFLKGLKALKALKRGTSRVTQGVRGQVIAPASKRLRSKDVHYAELASARDRWQAARCPQTGPGAEQLVQLSQRYLAGVSDRPRTQELGRRIDEARALIERLSPPPPSPRVAVQLTRWDGPSPPVVTHPALDLRGTPLAPIPESVPSMPTSQETMPLEPSPIIRAPARRVRFQQVEAALAEFRARDETHAPELPLVNRLRDTASGYLASHPDKQDMGTVAQLRRTLALHARSLAEAQEKKLLSLQAQGMDPADLPLFHPRLRDRAEARRRDASRLCKAHPVLNRRPDASSDRLIRQSDGRIIYRLVPLNTREASTPDIGPQHAALASGLRFKLQDTGLDLRIPDATPVNFEGQSAMQLDAVDLPPPRDLSRIAAEELHRAVLAQWIVGRPSPRWEDFGQDDRGRLLMRATPFSMCTPRAMARTAQQGVSKLFKTTHEALHQPLAPTLRAAVLKLDLALLEERLATERNLIDLACGMKGQIDHRSAAHYAYLPKESVARLMEPLRALQTALRESPDLPLAMVLADAADVLERSSFT